MKQDSINYSFMSFFLINEEALDLIRAYIYFCMSAFLFLPWPEGCGNSLYNEFPPVYSSKFKDNCSAKMGGSLFCFHQIILQDSANKAHVVHSWDVPWECQLHWELKIIKFFFKFLACE